MFTARLRYFTLLLLCLTCYFASGEWLSWIVLLSVAVLPWISLILSLPAMLSFRLSATGVDAVTVGEQTEAWLLGSCNYPMPPFRGRIRVTELLTREHMRYDTQMGLPTDHCGGLTVAAEKGFVCDYLGIFAFPVRCDLPKRVLVQPRPEAPVPPAQLSQFNAVRWRPKPGGGFSENHELRLYRPGDNLNQVHWKLSAKTGSLIVRQAMEQCQGLVLLTMTLGGTPEQLDRKLGRLLYLGSELIGRSIRFEVRALTGEGILTFSVGDERELHRCVDSLLCSPVAVDGSIRDLSYTASWQYHIGGDADEA